MWVLDLVRLGVDALEWQQVSSFDVRAPLSSEGASLVAAPAYGALVAFGGYNGVFHNTVSVFKPAEPTEQDANGEGSMQRYVARFCSFPLAATAYADVPNAVSVLLPSIM